MLGITPYCRNTVVNDCILRLLGLVESACVYHMGGRCIGFERQALEDEEGLDELDADGPSIRCSILLFSSPDFGHT